jgi:hypothetical protein
MSTPRELPSRRSRLTRHGLALCLIVAALAGLSRLTRPTAEDHRFVGVWRLQCEAYPANTVTECELRPDGAMHMKVLDSQTRNVVSDMPDWGRWQAGSDRFREARSDGEKHREWEYEVAWDGPDQFQLSGVAHVPPVTWTRAGRLGPP